MWVLAGTSLLRRGWLEYNELIYANDDSQIVKSRLEDEDEVYFIYSMKQHTDGWWSMNGVNSESYSCSVCDIWWVVCGHSLSMLVMLSILHRGNRSNSQLAGDPTDDHLLSISLICTIRLKWN